MSFLLDTAAKDLRRHRRDPLGLAFWIGIPLAIGGIISLIAGGGGGPTPQAHVLVADLDDSFLSGLLVGALSQDAAGGLIRAEEVTEEEGRSRMEKGKATALLVIPEGFGTAVLEETPTTLELLTNPSQRILPGIVEEGLRIVVDASFYAHRLVGDDLREFASGPPSGNTFPDERIAEFSVKINRIVDRLSESLSPLLIDLEVASVKEEEEEAEPSVSVALLFVPSILFMSLVMMAQGLSADLWHERESRTLRRAVVSPRNVTEFLGGKLVAAAAIMTAVCLVTLAITYPWFSIPLATLPLALVWAVFSGAMMTILMMVLQMLSSSARAGSIVTMGLMFPLLMAGGSFFPFEAMPDGMAAIGKLTPNGWALTQLKAILLQRVVPGELAIAFVLLLAVGSALFGIGARRLRTGFAQG